jgi:magnesium transporter
MPPRARMLGTFLKPDVEELIAQKDWGSLRDVLLDLDPPDTAEILEDLPPEDSGILFRLLPRDRAATVFEYLPLDQQSELVSTLGTEQLMNVLNEMAPDDRTRLFEELPAEVTRRALATLNPEEMKVARQLLGYPEKTAGRYMTPDYLSVRPEMTAAQALDCIRQNAKKSETLNVVYVTDDRGFLLDDLRLATIVLARPDQPIRELNDRHLVSIPATAPREQVVAAFEKYDRVALPVTDSQGVLVGIITVDDVLDVAEEEATEDMQKMGGMEALEAPYMESGFVEMIRKRAGWLAVLFLGEMLTATAMGHFEHELARAVVLATFLPLIISSGGNSGSQATSLIIRSLAVRELEPKDWWRVFVRELGSGTALGLILALIGGTRILLWQRAGFHDYGPHYLAIALIVGGSLVGVVLLGTLAGSMLPFLLRRAGFDPATASAPAVATLVDVGGLLIYFTLASVLLGRL